MDHPWLRIYGLFLIMMTFMIAVWQGDQTSRLIIVAIIGNALMTFPNERQGK